MASAGNCTSTTTSIPIPACHEFLDELIGSLTAYEWRYLHDRLMQRCFRCDVFGKLPLELAMCIAAYLDPLDVVALRRVSRRWHSLLTADEMSKQVYLKLFPQQGLPESAKWTEHMDQKLCCEHALACGRPWSKADFVDSSLDLTAGYMSQAQLHGSHFTWRARALSRNLREHIAVLSLGTGSISRYFPLTRSPLNAETLVLSDILVGCLSRDGNCEIFEILRGTCHSFRLPSTGYQQLILQGDKVACINVDLHPLVPTASLNIITWDLAAKTHRQTSLEVSVEVAIRDDILNGRGDRLEWILGYDSIHMIEPGVSSEICLTEIGISIYQAQDARMSLNICKVCEIDTRQNKVITIQQIRIADTQSPWLFEKESLPSLGHDVVVIPLQEIDTNWRHYFKIASLDCLVYSFKSQYPRYDPPHRRRGGLYTAPRPLSSSTYQVITNTTEGIGLKFITWEHNQLILREVVPEISDEEALAQLAVTLRDDLDDGCALSEEHLQRSSLWPWFGNNRFLIIPGRGRIKVYCFDRSFVLPNEDLSYRKEREHKAEARKAKRIHGFRPLDNLKSSPIAPSCS